MVACDESGTGSAGGDPPADTEAPATSGMDVGASSSGIAPGGSGADTEDGVDSSGTTGDDESGTDPDPTDPDPAMGDEYSENACTLLAGDLQPLQAATLEAEASQALIIPSPEHAWRIEGNEPERYVTVEIPEWEVPVRFFVTEGVGVEVLGAFPVAPQAPMEDCPGYTDQAVIVHMWGPYVVRLEGEGPIELSVIVEDTEQ
ncbi:MAG: hypothetical protein AAGF11_12460 [Myxococcota bacterium]